MRRVVITGIGAVTPLGNNIETTWTNLTEKISGISQITKFDPSGLMSRIAGELKDFSPEEYISKKDIQRLDPFIHYAFTAAIMALEDAGLISRGSGVRGQELGREFELAASAGVIIGSSRGGITSMEKALTKNLQQGSPFSAYLMSASTINMASSYISMRLGIKGPSLGISTACASGTNAIGEAFRMIQNGDIDIAIAGGSEAPICRLAVGGYAASGALSRRNQEPEKASRPFDKGRDGFVISEGSGILVIEELSNALERGTRIYAELAGYGTSSDAFHQTKPDSNGESAAIIKALNDADIMTDEVDYINAHATSTVLGDKAEAEAIRKVFGKRVNEIYVGSCKSMLGHMLGAAGAVETAITALSVNRGRIIPTINLDNPDPACDLNHATSTIRKDINIAITNSFGFGGVNAVLALKRIF
ncbi:MAG: beta-ketoacyl-[acyl-carrier-protein] synthase [Nitrospirae bacterium]|nr:beta-ketoacyl-[acyl-carrier-protein] synthase [Nitrospirota bacterium]